MRRRFSRRQRFALALASGGHCAGCGGPIGPAFHADHRRPHARGGQTVLLNAQPLCADCNLKKGSHMPQLRPWQNAAHDMAIRRFLTSDDPRLFMVNAAPGAGKTLLSCAIAATLLQDGAIDRVVVIAPRSEVVNQWAADFLQMTGRPMSRVTGRDEDMHALGLDICATWAAVASRQDAFAHLCTQSRVLVICDEHHHAAVDAAWGEGADAAFARAAHVLILTGTPLRSDGGETVWTVRGADGSAALPADAVYTLTYGEAVDLGYCRPVTFHRHEGRFRIVLDDSSSADAGGTALPDGLTVSSQEAAPIADEHPAAQALRRALDFYRLACSPHYNADGTPSQESFQASMLSCATAELDRIRERMPRAGGLVIAPTIEVAEYFSDLLHAIEGERPMLVHSNMTGADGRIDAFRRSTKRWIVSVAMITEGVDIPRLRVLVYLPSALTELAFRQAVGRVVRSAGPDDDSRAYVVMPAFHILDAFAQRVEEEMPPRIAREERPPTKRCKNCRAENLRFAVECEKCGEPFPMPVPRFQTCASCDELTPAAASACQGCGTKFEQAYTVTLREALRDGAISRGVRLQEDELAGLDTNAERVRTAVLQSGDDALIRVMRTVPEECLGRLRRILSEVAFEEGAG
ncbi:DEAD/DEAH box helicase family protein [Sphingomonas sp. M1-B02]|uniref:DEAD/DEAH box helicase family protein n=1 Tax=Sphingomonas sp. M1-B02 TaxID=3114300 RepID=UPI00223EB755|nr:DEAD/DEAH box helicase family protein [Sphingomonas sp. S6-11]UZK67847.1 DEAD/DEAH box helicase family protein [Sphingomonas sp. S6-11]